MTIQSAAYKRKNIGTSLVCILLIQPIHRTKGMVGVLLL